MSDDWQVVEGALRDESIWAPLSFDRNHPQVLAALARLREREATLEGEVEFIKKRHGQQADRANHAEARIEVLEGELEIRGHFEARVAELEREKAVYIEDVWAVERKRVRLEEALREYAKLRPDEIPYVDTINDPPDIGRLARSVLGYAEDHGQVFADEGWVPSPLAHEEEK